MARVTVEDCLSVVPNPFHLVLLAAQRARSLNAGAQVTVAREADKNTVIALREIAGGSVHPSEIEAVLMDAICRGPAVVVVPVEAEASDLIAESDDADAPSGEDDASEFEVALSGNAAQLAA